MGMSRIFNAKNKRKRLLKDYPYCTYCGLFLDEENATLDHKRPFSQKGKSHFSNLCLSCLDCNQLKGDICFLDYKIEFWKFIEEILTN